MNKTLLYTIEMPNYPRKIKLSDSRRAKYWLKHKVENNQQKLPKKYLYNTILGRIKYVFLYKDYSWVEHKLSKGKSEYRLYNNLNDEYVVKNAKVAGTEKWEVINGQKIYNAGYHPITRAKIMHEIHEFYTLFLSGLHISSEHFPLYIECEIWDLANDPISKGKKFDIFNRGFPYCKAFEDALTAFHVIPDDNTDYVICPSHPIFIPIDNLSDKTPKLIFKIYSISQN